MPDSATLGVPRIVAETWRTPGKNAGLTAFDVDDYESPRHPSTASPGPYTKVPIPCPQTCTHTHTNTQPPLVLGTYTSSAPPVPFAKWSPEPSVVGAEACAAAVEGLDGVHLLQYHAARYDGLEYIDNLYHLSRLQSAGKFTHLGVTDFDLAHLQLLAASDYQIASDTVSVSVLDRRAEAGGLLAWCAENDVAVLAYGVTLGGFVGEEWVGANKPRVEEIQGWENAKEMGKYLRWIEAAGGWTPFQALLTALSTLAKKYNTTIAAIATRYVLDLGVAAVVTSSPGNPDAATTAAATGAEAETLTLDDADRALIAAAQADLTPLPGDCGDEYRFAPFLTPDGKERVYAGEEAVRAKVEKVLAEGGRVEKTSGSAWEPVVGYCRALRLGPTLEVAGTTTRAHPSGHGVIGGDSVEHQSTFIFDIIRGALRPLGGSVGDLTRTRVLFADVTRWLECAKVHGREVGRYGIRPGNTMMGGQTFVLPGALLEIESQGVLGYADKPRLRL